MGGNAVKKIRVPTFHGLCFFPELKWEHLCFFSQHFPPMSGTLFFFRAEIFGLSVTSSCMLEPGFWIWRPGMQWHYNTHQTQHFKDLIPKKSDLIKALFFSLTYWAKQALVEDRNPLSMLEESLCSGLYLTVVKKIKIT